MSLAILSVEDEVEVREALERDLECFWSHVRLETAEDVDDAWAAIDAVLADGDELALVLSDHRLPGRSGVDFLVELAADERFEGVRTVLVTGQADQDDTIRALNLAGLDHYVAKPWNPQDLVVVVRDQLTTYVLDRGVPPLPYLPVLDGVRVMEALR
ncbi:response regulator [Schaalia sp. 19OD2882]|uniref:response regulator n=1 Tax=Schaalia sp. 19OD2882 TaxID=2794089 RepID=UPI001C1E98B7|nr:response regulator [Schaalia sp. 19OD2882]QWW19642.1 response regulator [Schaalia sp. 19OD2882]